MLFNSFNFFFFIVPVLVGFYLINNWGGVKTKNLFLLAVSYIFYGLFDVRFTAILAFVTMVNYITILALSRLGTQNRKIILTVGIVCSLLPLAFFKYTYFFLNDVLMIEGKIFGDIILPVGISFFTFQALSYTIDIYRGKETKCPQFIDFALFVSFFPCVLSGPIERARNLMPQFMAKQKPDIYVIFNGVQVLLYGVFLKNVVAENVGWFTNSAFRDYQHGSGLAIILAVLLYSIQIYCDFAGYSNMAIGVGRMLGFDIRKNFDFPYFSSNIKMFWKKWHMSLTSWFTEYVYIPLGGNRVSQIRWIVNILIVFLVSGFWHGAAWTFIIWGLIHGIYQIVEHYTMPKQETHSVVVKFFRGVLLYIVVSVAWLLFRSNTIYEAFDILMHCVINPFGSIRELFTMQFVLMAISVVLFVILEVVLYKRYVKMLEFSDRHISWANIAFVIVVVISIELFGLSGTSFVYFQF